MSCKLNEETKLLNEHYTALGKAVYESHSDAPLAGFEINFNAIKGSLGAINELQALLRQIKGVKLCPCCGKEVGVEELFCSACGTNLAEEAEKEAPYTVSTTYGKVQGVEENGYVAYKGIPFAKPPVGELRFKPPVDPEGWEGVRVCDTYGPIEPRPGSAAGGADRQQCRAALGGCIYRVYDRDIDSDSRCHYDNPGLPGKKISQEA